MSSEKPAKMSAEDWEKIKDLPEGMRGNLISMFKNINIAAPSKNIESLEKPPIKEVQLPLWPETVRATPNSFLRSALFAAIQGKTRTYLKRAKLGSQGNYVVRFTGQQLDQADLDVWEQAAHLARNQPLGNVCIFTGNSFLKSIGRSNGKSNYQWLNDSLTRLVACAVEIKCASRVFTGSLVSSFLRDETTGHFKITFDPDTLKLFGSSDWSSIDWEHRTKLKNKPLALWLHGYVSSHAEPLPVKVDTLREMSGSKGIKRNFKIALKRAFEDLEDVAGIRAVLNGDLVYISKTPTISQKKHLKKKALL